jgi:hypothetical protein
MEASITSTCCIGINQLDLSVRQRAQELLSSAKRPNIMDATAKRLLQR